MTPADVLADLRAAGADLMVQGGQLYFRGLESTEDKFAAAIDQNEGELIALLDQEAAVAEAERLLRNPA